MIKNIFLIGVAVILLIIAAVIYFVSQNDFARGSHFLHQQAASSTQNTETLVAVENDFPRFEFYTLLPETAIPIEDENIQSNDEEMNTENNATNKSPDESVSSKQYILQIASLSHRREAEKLKQQLSHQGFDVYIEEYDTEEMIWYRIRWGPFPSLQAAEHALDELNTHHINAMLQRVH